MSDINSVSGVQRLKVKRKTLASEARIIRELEKKKLRHARALLGIFSKKHDKGEEKPQKPEYTYDHLSGDDVLTFADKHYAEFWGLNRHRHQVVRKAARISHLAHNFMKGTPYEVVEKIITSELPNVDRLIQEVSKFSNTDRANDTEQTLLRERVIQWLGFTQKENGKWKIA